MQREAVAEKLGLTGESLFLIFSLTTTSKAIQLSAGEPRGPRRQVTDRHTHRFTMTLKKPVTSLVTGAQVQ